MAAAPSGGEGATERQRRGTKGAKHKGKSSGHGVTGRERGSDHDD